MTLRAASWRREVEAGVFRADNDSTVKGTIGSIIGDHARQGGRNPLAPAPKADAEALRVEAVLGRLNEIREQFGLSLHGKRSTEEPERPPTASEGLFGMIRSGAESVGEVVGAAGDALSMIDPRRPNRSAPERVNEAAERIRQRDVIGDGPEQVVRFAEGAATDLDRATGAPIRGALRHPSSPIRGAIDAVIDPGSARGRDLGGIRSLPDEGTRLGLLHLTPRNVAGFGAEALLDVGVGGEIASGARGLRALNRTADDAALAAARGPVEDSTKGGIFWSSDPGRALTTRDLPPPRRMVDEVEEVVPAVPVEPEVPIRSVLEELTPREIAGQGRDSVGMGLLRRYEGRVNTQGLEIRQGLDQGNQLLRSLNLGERGARSQRMTRTPETEALFRSLHGEGPVPQGMEDIAAAARAQIDAETAATLDFDPKFMAHPDYFPRGWRHVEVGKPSKTQNAGQASMGARPGFSKPRVDATFDEILANTYTRPDGSTFKLEPVSWNPFEMAALRRVAGAEFREQTELVKHLRDFGVAIPVDGPVPAGYRVPQVGVAFEGKPRIVPRTPARGEGQAIDAGRGRGEELSFFGYTEKHAVPNRIADVLENMYGSPMSLGKAPLPGGREVDILGAIRGVSRGSKRVKLLGSLFQHVDFATRTGFATFGGAIDDVLAGKPLSAVQKAVRLPKSIGELAYATASSGRRQSLRNQILSGDPIVEGRPGISLKGVSEAGWTQTDISFLPRDIKTVVQDAAKPPPGATSSMISRAKDRAQRVDQAWQDGLFDGVYPQAQITALKNFIVPRLVRQHPDWTDGQIMANAATEVNKMFSSLGNFQTILKNPGMRELMHNLFFSTNEAEGLVRGAFSTVSGPNKGLWGEFAVGGALFLGLVSNVIHFAATGQPLPFERYKPIKRDEHSSLGVNYDSRFLSPNVPLVGGAHGAELTLDLMGQMDTTLRMLDPIAWVSNRFSVPVRAGVNQAKGEDFEGNKVEGIGDRVGMLAEDMGAPIGAGNLAFLGGSDPGRLGEGGRALESVGLNVNAETNAMLRDRVSQEVYGKPFADLLVGERKIVNEDQRLQGRFESEPSDSGTIEQRTTAAFDRREQVQAENESELLGVIDAGADGQRLREAIAEFKSNNYIASQALIGGDIESAIARDDHHAPDVFAGRYWSVSRDADPLTGYVDFDAITAERQGILQEAVAAGVDPEYITGNGAGTYRGSRFDDPTVRAAIESYEDFQSELNDRGFWQADDAAWQTILDRMPDSLKQEASQFRTFHDYRAALAEQYAERLIERGIDPGVATQRADTAVNGQSIVQSYAKWLRRGRSEWLEQNPDLAERVIADGYISPSLRNLASSGNPVGGGPRPPDNRPPRPPRPSPTH